MEIMPELRLVGRLNEFLGKRQKLPTPRTPQWQSEPKHPLLMWWSSRSQSWKQGHWRPLEETALPTPVPVPAPAVPAILRHPPSHLHQRLVQLLRSPRRRPAIRRTCSGCRRTSSKQLDDAIRVPSLYSYLITWICSVC